MATTFTVSELNTYIRQILEYDVYLTSVQVTGEVSNFRPNASGHLYFTLKDAQSVLRCVMFRTYAAKLPFRLENGMHISVRGRVTVYERDGVYQVYADKIEPQGIGSLAVAFEQLKEKLSAEGLFSDARKKKLPYLPTCIAVVTSPTGAVIQDIQNVLFRRFPKAHLKLIPVRVQGTGASGEICKAIAWINQNSAADVIIVARGGGSLEDLWAFNEEKTARAIASSRIPVISAVGHETDITIADFVADLRAPTPSAAAELVVPELGALEEEISGAAAYLHRLMRQRITIQKEKLSGLLMRPALKNPLHPIYVRRQWLDAYSDRQQRAAQRMIEKHRYDLKRCVQVLEAFSPLKTLIRGYTYTTQSTELISSVTQISVTDPLVVHFQDGQAVCTIRSVVPDKEKQDGN